MSGSLIPDFAKQLLAWFDLHGRHDLPWQHPRTPYRVWLSEIMLQQTQVTVVIPYFQRFIARFPTLTALAQADEDSVMRAWAGLGYYARARHMLRAAQQCVADHAAQLPCELTALMALPGIGRSTAGAILAQAWQQRAPILDGNVKRLLCRLHGIHTPPGNTATGQQLWQLSDAYLAQPPSDRLADYTQALMDFGATVCTRAQPACLRCPFQTCCVAKRDQLTASLPTPNRRKPIPERHAVALLAQHSDGQILLQRRPSRGIWAALWTLPQADTAEELQAWCDSHLSLSLTEATPLPPIAHTFSHYRLRLQLLHLHAPHRALPTHCQHSLRWVNAAQRAQLGLPAPIRLLLTSQC